MTDFRVRWEIDVDGDDSIEAVTLAHNLAGSDSTATIYTVRPTDDQFEARWEEVDVGVPGAPVQNVVWEYGQKALFAMAQKMVADGGDLDAVMEMLEKPQKWPELLSAATLDRAFDAVSPGADIPDTLEDDTELDELKCHWCGAVVVVDDKGPYSSGYWVTSAGGSADCRAKSPVGLHEVKKS